jgi:hypothetical protein
MLPNFGPFIRLPRHDYRLVALLIEMCAATEEALTVDQDFLRLLPFFRSL